MFFCRGSLRFSFYTRPGAKAVEGRGSEESLCSGNCHSGTGPQTGRGNPFYIQRARIAAALRAYHEKHRSVPMADVAERFLGGFEFRTREMRWRLSVMRDSFEAFDPPVPPRYAFRRKWMFAMWALERQERRLPALRKSFLALVAAARPLESGGGDMV